MGGTVLWHIERGDQVFVVYATKGERGTWIHISGKKLGRIRETEAYRSAKIMDIKNIIFLGLEDRNIICDNITFIDLINDRPWNWKPPVSIYLHF